MTPEDVKGALAAVRRWGVDLCSGIRAEGALEDARLTDFVAAVRSADARG